MCVCAQCTVGSAGLEASSDREASSGLWSLLPPECVARKTAWATFHQSIRVKRETKGDIYTALVTVARMSGAPEAKIRGPDALKTALFSVTL